MNKRKMIFITAISTIVLIIVVVIVAATSKKVSTEEMAALRKDFEKTGAIVAHAQHCGSDLSPTGVELKLIDSVEKRGLDTKQRESLAQYFDYGYKKKAEALHGNICSFEEREWTIQAMNRTMLSLDPKKR